MPGKKSGNRPLRCCICGRGIEDPVFSVEVSPGSRAHFECAASRAVRQVAGDRGRGRRRPPKPE